MDAIYARQRHIYDLTRKYYLLGRDRLIARLEVPVGGTVLEVGCGTGRNLIAVAKRCPTARLFGLDISAEMLTTARANVAATGLADRIVLKQGDATDFDARALFDWGRFDRVFFSYTLSMIPDWRAALAHGAGLTAGALHFVDFGQFEGLPKAFGTGMKTWLAKFDVAPRAELIGVAEQLASDSFHEIESRSLFRGYAWSGVLTR